jgi:hypothetical protein
MAAAGHTSSGAVGFHLVGIITQTLHVFEFLAVYVGCDYMWTASVVWSSEFLAANPEVPCSIPALPDFLSSNVSGTGSI